MSVSQDGTTLELRYLDNAGTTEQEVSVNEVRPCPACNDNDIDYGIFSSSVAHSNEVQASPDSARDSHTPPSDARHTVGSGTVTSTDTCLHDPTKLGTGVSGKSYKAIAARTVVQIESLFSVQIPYPCISIRFSSFYVYIHIYLHIASLLIFALQNYKPQTLRASEDDTCVYSLARRHLAIAIGIGTCEPDASDITTTPLRNRKRSESWPCMDAAGMHMHASSRAFHLTGALLPLAALCRGCGRWTSLRCRACNAAFYCSRRCQKQVIKCCMHAWLL